MIKTPNLQLTRFPSKRSEFPSPYALWVFAVTAQHENFTNAGSEIGLSQSAISHQIKVLETSLGFSVFDRVGKNITLNENGKLLYPVVRNCFADMSEAIIAIRKESRQRSSTLTISTTSFFASRWLSPRLVGFMKENPNIAVQVVHEVTESEIRETADVEIRWGNGKWGDIETELLLETPMTIACRPDLLSANREKIEFGILDGLMFLGNETTLSVWEAWRDRYCGETPPETITGPLIHDSAVRTQAALDGQGFIITNQLINEDILADRLTIPFNEDLNGFAYFVACRKTASNLSMVSAFVDWLFREARDNTPTEIARNAIS